MGDLVASTDARDALTKLEKEPVSLVHKLSLMGCAYRPIPDNGERIGSTEVLAVADTLGFKRLGIYDMVGILPLVMRPKRERYVDPTGVVVMSMRKGTPTGPFEAQMSRYFLVTYFDDGSVITTWGKERPPVAPGKRLVERGGTGELDFDYKAHLAAVGEHAKDGRKALAVADLATSLALGHWYDTRLRPESALSMQVSRIILLVLIGFPIVKWILRRHG